MFDQLVCNSIDTQSKGNHVGDVGTGSLASLIKQNSILQELNLDGEQQVKAIPSIRLTGFIVNSIGLAGASSLCDAFDFNQTLFILTLRGAIVKGLHEVLTKVAPPVCTRCRE